MLCTGACTIIGGGSIVAPTGLPAGAWQSHGVYQDEFRSRGTVAVSDVTITGWTGTAIRGRKIKVSDSTLVGNHVGISAMLPFRMERCSVDQNYVGVQAVGTTTVSDSTMTGNGIYAIIALKTTKMLNTVVNNTDGAGFFGGRLYAEGSSVQNSCQNSTEAVCADLVTRRRQRPVLVSSTCGTSPRDDGLATWNVCTMD